MNLHFNGAVGAVPDPESSEWIVLEACADEKAWPRIKRLARGEFEDAIDRLRNMGWGFEWISLQ